MSDETGAGRGTSTEADVEQDSRGNSGTSTALVRHEPTELVASEATSASLEATLLERSALTRISSSLLIPLILVGMFLNFVDLRADVLSPTRIAMVVILLVGAYFPIYSTRKGPVRRVVKVDADRDGLRIDGAMVLPVSRVVAGGITGRLGGKIVVALLGRSRWPDWFVSAAFRPPDVTLEIDDETSAARLFRALDMDLSAKTTDVTLYRVTALWQALAPLLPFFLVAAGIFALTFWALLGITPVVDNPTLRGILFASSMLMIGVVTIPLYVSFSQWLGRRRIVVGVDGVHVSGSPARFIPYAEIESVLNWEKIGVGDFWLILVLRSAERVKVSRCVGLDASRSVDKGNRVNQAGGITVGDPWADLLAWRIREGLDTYRTRRGDAAGDLAMLTRGGRATSVWLSALRALGAGEYRTASTRPAWLEEILGDPSASPEYRIAAAVTLHATEATEATAGIRRAARTTASPPLKTALEAVLSSPEDSALEAIVERAIAVPGTALAKSSSDSR